MSSHIGSQQDFLVVSTDYAMLTRISCRHDNAISANFKQNFIGLDIGIYAFGQLIGLAEKPTRKS